MFLSLAIGPVLTTFLTTYIAVGNRPKSQKHMMFSVQEGGVEKICTTSHKKKRKGEEAPMPHTVRVLPQTLEPGPSSRFQPPRPFERLPLCFFRKVLVGRWLSRVFPSGSSDVEENCVTPQLSSAVIRFVLGVKLYAFSLSAMATFTLFDQVSRACP